jgi:acetyl-CoA synthetase (ADP-forming)
VRLKSILKKVGKEKRNFLLENEAREVLEEYNIPFAKWAFVKSSSQAIELAKKIGFPVVLKVVSKDILHKSEVGGVMVNLKSSDEVGKAFEQIMKNVKKHKPKAKIEGMLISKMVEEGKQVIVGGIKDPQFGHVIMFGAGGIYTELAKDTSLRIVPITKKDAEEMIAETKIYEILKGYRGEKCDINALIKILLNTSKFLEENKEVKELDINPIIAHSKGAIAVDARIIVE